MSRSGHGEFADGAEKTKKAKTHYKYYFRRNKIIAEKRIGSNVNFDATLEVLFLIIRERIQK